MKCFIVVLALIVCSCSTYEEPTIEFTYIIESTAEINPNVKGQPSPVLVRIFLLSSDLNFLSATYDQLFDRDSNVLGSEYIAVNDFLIHPNETKPIELEISENAKFIGVAVGYRSLENVTWRTAVKVPDESYFFGEGINIHIDTLSVRVLNL